MTETEKGKWTPDPDIAEDEEWEPDPDIEPKQADREDESYPGGDPEAGPETPPGLGGYEGRDPTTEMPKIPSVPDSQEEAPSHDAAPDEDKERWGGE